MSECYKCGRQLPEDQVECDPPCFGNPPEDITPTEAQIKQSLREYETNTVPIDWDTVRTVDDLKEIMRAMMFDDRVYRGSLAYTQLRRFLKEKNPHD
jgi:hypothetical protein